jgi:hypothetical protein
VPCFPQKQFNNGRRKAEYVHICAHLVSENSRNPGVRPDQPSNLLPAVAPALLTARALLLGGAGDLKEAT